MNGQAVGVVSGRYPIDYWWRSELVVGGRDKDAMNKMLWNAIIKISTLISREWLGGLK